MSKTQKTLIAVPANDMCHSRFAQSLVGLNKPENTYISFAIGSFIPKSRDELAHIAMDQDMDYIMWLDSDMVFEQNTMMKLMLNNKDIVSGLYFHRVFPFKPEMYRSGEPITDYPDKPFEVESVGLGCCLMKVDVLRDIYRKEHDLFAPIGRTSEDIAFCMRAARCGYSIWVDPNIKVGHMGYINITEQYGI